jgi:hypothetical protein
MQKRRVPAPAPDSHRTARPSTQLLPEIVMTRTASRSLITLAAVLCFPIIAAAQATQAATPAPKPVMTAKPAGAPAAKPVVASTASPAAAAPSTAAAARTRPTTPAATATPTPKAASAATPAAAPVAATPAPAAAGPARDARGRFIAKGAAAPAAGNHATCKDGSAWTGAQRSGACARHGGVKAWN